MAGEGELADIADDALKYDTYEQVSFLFEYDLLSPMRCPWRQEVVLAGPCLGQSSVCAPTTCCQYSLCLYACAEKEICH